MKSKQNKIDQPQPQPRKTLSRDHSDTPTRAPTCALCHHGPHPDSYGHSYRPRTKQPPATDDKPTDEDYDNLVRDAMLWRAQEMHKMQSAPRGEQWTFQSVANLFVDGGYPGVADAHNAALAAEKEMTLDSDKWAMHYKNQCELAGAETQKAWAAWHEIKEQLAAEQEKLKEELKKLEHFHQAELLKIEQQLLQAQAAIAEAKAHLNKIIFDSNSRLSDVLGALNTVDLSALDKHDAEVRKPFIDLLTSVDKSSPAAWHEWWFRRDELLQK